MWAKAYEQMTKSLAHSAAARRNLERARLFGLPIVWLRFSPDMIRRPAVLPESAAQPAAVLGPPAAQDAA
jgi:hypothetical protein